MSHFVIIGLGSIGRRHAQNLKALRPEAGFTILRHREARDAFIDALEARVVNTLEAALEPQPDLIVLATPSALHIDLLPDLIAAGVPLMIEKPMVTTLEDCDQIAEALAKAPSARRVSGFNFRHVASLQKAREIIQDGTLGAIVRASFKAGQWLPDWRPGTDYRDSYSSSRALGGGVELDLVHEIDVARWFFGELDLRFAIGGQLSGLEMDCHDVSTIVLTPPKGGPIVDISLDYVARSRIRRYEIVGSGGTLTWDIGGRLDLVTPDGVHHILTEAGGFDIGQSYVSMMAHLLASTDPVCKSPLQALSDGLDSTRLAIAAAQQDLTP